MRKLLVVESPNKAKTLRPYLERLEPGAWSVVASVGHVRGLAPMANQRFEDVVDPSRGFAERFEVLAGKEDVLTRLRRAVAEAGEVYLATDEDREGEAIAWHLADLLRLKAPHRAVTHEITETGLRAAIEAASRINEGKVEAQRARAVLDYLIGMEVSRMLWRFGAKSAGRLQSCALRILVERERAIQQFTSTPFWRLQVRYGEGFTATVGGFERPSQDELDADDGVVNEPRLVAKRFTDEGEARAALGVITRGAHVVEHVEVKPLVRNPPPPFTTADLLGTAAGRLRFSAEQTTRLAQGLFEKGVVTYIRTDSTALAAEAVTEIRAYVGAHHGRLLPDAPIKARQSASAQAAHEAIRPTRMTKAPGGELSAEEYQLYELIFERTLCCQAKPAELETTTLTIAPEGSELRLLAHGVVVVDKGWMELAPPRAEADAVPKVTRGQRLTVVRADVEAGKTKAPPRFGERALVKFLERRGVGRPSTYATMLATLTRRGYIRKEKRMLVPEPLGFTAEELVRLGFDELTQVGFTAKTEGALDSIEDGKLGREVFLGKFYAHFRELHKAAVEKFKVFAAAHPELDREAVVDHGKPCPKCSSRMVVRVGSKGRFARCTKEDCGQTVNLEPPTYHKRPCPKCAGKVVEREYERDGKKHGFYRCESEACGWSSSAPPPRVGKAPCPKCGGRMLLRSSTHGEFWSCSLYPECKGTLSYEPPRKRKLRAGV